ncbi:hypothetical protein [Caproicibacter sp.]|uniref:hypothetical protein n=1 Tax=Caproicibacter sp. TaxID=2814884 RepID=UPI0039890770
MRYQKINLIYIVVCFCVLTIASTVLMFANRSYEEAANKVVDFSNKNVDTIYLRVSDVYGEENQETLSDFFSEKNALNRMKEFHQSLNKKFNYLEFDTQMLLLLDNSFDYKDEFRTDYGTDSFRANDKIGVSLKSAQINKKAYDYFSLKNQIFSGQSFHENDFTFNDKAVPAILGYNYINSADIGDIINFNYLSKDISIKVIGFLKRNTSITINNNIYFMDDYILIPSLEVKSTPISKDDKRFQNILYSLKNWGYIKINNGEDYYNYKAKVDAVSNKLNLKYVLNEGYVYPYITNISNSMQSSKGVFRLLSALLFAILSIVFTFLTIWHFNRNKKIYAIHLISGCSISQLKSRIFSGITIQFILSFGLSVFINMILMGHEIIYFSERILLNQSVGQIAVLLIMVIIGICLVLNIYINKSNMYTSIQKED